MGTSGSLRMIRSFLSCKREQDSNLREFETLFAFQANALDHSAISLISNAKSDSNR